jgi:tetratricopeptide (TPR) repeat protein
LLVDLGHHLARAGRVGEALPLLRRARSIAQAAQDWGVLAQVLGLLGYLQHIRANVARAAVLCVRGLHYQRMTGPMATSQLKGHIDVPRLYRELGRYTQSLALLDELRSGQAKDREYRLSTLGDADLSFVWLQLGQPTKALQALRDADRPPPGAYAPSWLVARARIEHWAGRPAHALLRDCFEQVNGENRVLRWLAGRDLAMSLPPDEGAALAERLVVECSQVDSPLALWPLHVAWCDRLLAAGDVHGAAATARRVLATMGQRIMPSLYHPHAWWIVGQALRAAQADAEARQADDCGLRWIRRALPHVPPLFRHSFLQANPFNARLLRLAQDTIGQSSDEAITSP